MPAAADFIAATISLIGTSVPERARPATETRRYPAWYYTSGGSLFHLARFSHIWVPWTNL
jgi:hypothetical protein